MNGAQIPLAELADIGPASRVAEIGRDLGAGGAIVVECAEKIVVPGLVDVHVHLREPGYEYKEDIASGTRAAARTGACAAARSRRLRTDRRSASLARSAVAVA